MLYGHGDDFYNAKNEVKINFSSNVWHGANLDKLKEHLIEHFDKLTRYPEPDAATLNMRMLAVCMSMRSLSSRHPTIYRSYPWRDRTSVGFVTRITRMES